MWDRQDDISEIGPLSWLKRKNIFYYTILFPVDIVAESVGL